MNIRLRLVSEYFVEPGRGFGSVDDSTISVAFINTGAEFFSQWRRHERQWRGASVGIALRGGGG